MSPLVGVRGDRLDRLENSDLVGEGVSAEAEGDASSGTRIRRSDLVADNKINK